jgi:hypothetical protein
MPPRSVTVTLRPGVGHATLPDDTSLSTAKPTRTISWEDYQKISPGALKTIISAKMNSAAAAKTGDDLTINSVALPNIPGTSVARKLGTVVAGFNSDAFKLVKAVDINLALGDSVCWADPTKDTVTKDRVGGTAASPLTFAGVALATVTAGRFCWIQIDGDVAVANVSGDVLGGEPLELDPTVDGKLRDVYHNEVQDVVLTGFSGTDSFKLTFQGQESAALVRGTNYDAPSIVAALEGLSNIGVGDVAVTNVSDAGFTVTFQGALADTDVGLLTVTSGSGVTGVATTSTTALAQAGNVVGTALADASAGTVEVMLRWAKTRPRHLRSRDFYVSP